MKKEKKEVKKENKYSFNSLLDILTSTFITAIKKISGFLSNKTQKPIAKAIIRIISCLIMLWILKIPFFIIGKIGEAIILVFGSAFKLILSAMWTSTIGYAYGIICLIILFKVIYRMSKDKEYQFEIKESKQVGKNLYTAIQSIFQVIIGISLIPLMLSDLFLFCALGMMFAVLSHGILVVGPFIMIIGLIIMVSISLSYIADVVYFDKGGDE